jgi:hypothetical protein
MPHATDWLPEPEIAVYADEAGRPESAYITLRRGSYARAVQPDPLRLVFLYLASDEVPLGLRLLEPLSIAATERLVARLSAWETSEAAAPPAPGPPVGVLPQNTLIALPRRVREASAALA